ncbi:DinB family protein [Lacinutrix chionoecetis]
MKKIIILIVVLLFTSLSSPILAQENDFVKDYLERLENSKKYLLLVAETMPEEKYNFKAIPESKSFSENLMHIGWAMDWHSQSLLGGREPRDWKTDTELKVKNKTKKEMIAKIDETFDATMKLIRQFDVSKLNDKLDYLGLNRTKRQILLLLTDHITHHRGQMIVYMRLNNIVPPKYIQFQ